MKKERKKSKKIIGKIKKKLYSNEFMEDNRISNKDFTRKRKLPFLSLVLFMINIIKQTLQKELTHFIKLISRNEVNVSKSAFSQGRVKLKPEAFIELNKTLVEEFYADKVYKKWKDFRLVAIDGSKISLPINSKELINKFGTLVNGMIIPEAQISSCYDPLNEIIIDSQIESIKIDERTLALKHINVLDKNDLIILDRGYGASWFYSFMINKNINFVNRISKSFLKESQLFLDSKEYSKVIEIKTCPQKSRYMLEKLNVEFKPFKIRLIKVILDDGEIELLASTLLDENKYPINVFKELYFKRWGVETNYNHLKNNIRLGDFTGLSEISIRQDFHVSSFIINLQSIISLDSQEDLDINNKNTEYNYKINKNLSLGFMKDRVINILTSNNPKYYEELKQLFKMNPVQIRNNRKNPRIFHRSRRKYSMNRKRSI
ncbi:MAG: IS4 family transposase [Nanoarchaeota archaeon]|mgnify:CR=1 FL=1